MSNEQNTDPKPQNDSNTPEDERKKQFDRMKEKFSKQNSPFGGGAGNGGNNFYWIYGIAGRHNV